MALSYDLLSQFAKITNDKPEEKKESTAYGTIVKYEGVDYVKLDGSDLLTPYTSTIAVEDGDRVLVTIKNHSATVTGSTSNPAANNKTVTEIGSKITEFEIVIADKVAAQDIEAINGYFESIKAVSGKYTELSAITAKVEALQAKYANLDHITAIDVNAINAEIESLRAEFGTFTQITTEDLEAINAEFTNVEAYNAKFTYVSAEVLKVIKGDIQELNTKKLDAETADIRYANIDFANITESAIRKIFSDTGIIKDLIVSEGTITGELVGVTIKGDLIEANTLVADKLVIKGENGLFYKLNVDALGEATASSDEKYQNGLDGSVIVANSITAEKISVNDLVAFGATIGGFHITDHSLYSGVKSSVSNTTQGVFLGDDGQIAIGDSNNYLKFFIDEDEKYKLELSASAIKFSTSGKTVEETIDEIGHNYMYVEGTQTTSTNKWTGVASELSSLTTGTQIMYHLPVASGNNVTLQLTLKDGTTTEAIECYFNGTTRLGTQYAAGATIGLVYDGTYWRVINPFTNTQVYNKTQYANNIIYSEDVTGNSIIVGTSEGYKMALAGTSFDINYPILWATVTKKAGDVSNGNYLTMPSCGLTRNAPGISLTQYERAYMVGTLNKNIFTVDDAVFANAPTQADGKYYISVGLLYSTNQIYFEGGNPSIYVYDETSDAFIPMPGPKGQNGQDGQDGQDGKDGADGSDGKSAYQIWLDAGNTGTEEDYLNSLKGTDGAPGQDGQNGKDAAIQSDTAPEDTSYMWYDTTTNQLKRYDGTEWIVVNDWSDAFTDLNSEIASASDNLLGEINDKDEEIKQIIEEYKVTVNSMFESTDQGYQMTFENLIERITNVDGTVNEHYEELIKYIRFENGSIILGEIDNPLKLTLTNNRLSFTQNGIEVAYVSDNKLYIYDGEFLNSLKLGRWVWIIEQDGGLSLNYV